MSESNNSFASLGPTLLARKGGAKPAMRPQFSPIPSAQPANAEPLEDLGWNDMGQEEDGGSDTGTVLELTPAPANPESEAASREQDEETKAQLAEAVKPEVRKQQEAIAEKVIANAPEKAVDAVIKRHKSKPATTGLSKAKTPGKKRAAFTLRLDPERHLKLRLACTVKNKSAQQIVTDALDTLLEELPEIEALAVQVSKN